ncbi:MAG: hypothetical protein FWG64_03580 [Firmicutes bacterium]|nr:hypothetical protein [Bacillota bacterium]
MNINTNNNRQLWYNEWKQAQNGNEEDNIANFGKAVDEWKNQVLSRGTALTEEEKEQIKEIIARWLEENPLETDEDRQKFRAFVQEVYTMFGAKHDTAYILEDTILSIFDERTNLSQFARETLLNVLDTLNPSRANRTETSENVEFVAPSRIYPVQINLKQRIS